MPMFIQMQEHFPPNALAYFLDINKHHHISYELNNMSFIFKQVTKPQISNLLENVDI